MLQGRQVECLADNSDARSLALADGSASLVVTSPPYVTSYEYADLHQLTTLWLGYSSADGFREFRSRFIGSIQKQRCRPNAQNQLYSELAKDTIDNLRTTDLRMADAAATYFLEMQQAFGEINRVLCVGGRAAIVIGDTDLKKIKIKNAEIFIQTLEESGFKTCKVIERPV